MKHYNLSSYIQHLSYLGVFLWFLILEQFTPIPEEVSLMTVGYVAEHTGLNIILCGIIALLGLLINDNFLFFISARGSKFSQKMIRKIQPQLMERIEKNIRTNAVKTLVVIALIPKLRFLSPILAGIMGVSWHLFLVVNSVATIMYLIFYMAIGVFFHKQMVFILHEISLLGHGVFVLCMVIVSIYILLKIRKQVLKKRNHQSS